VDVLSFVLIQKKEKKKKSSAKERLRPFARLALSFFVLGIWRIQNRFLAFF